METLKKYLNAALNNFKKYGLIYLILIVYVLFCFLLNFSICPFKLILGIPCPGCGLTRAFISLLKGNLILSLQYNPLLILAFIFIFIFFFKDLKLPGYLANNKLVLLSLLIVVISTYFLRMIFNYGVEPITFEENSIVGLIIKFFKWGRILND